MSRVTSTASHKKCLLRYGLLCRVQPARQLRAIAVNLEDV